MTTAARPLGTARSAEHDLVSFARSLRWARLPEHVRTATRRLVGDALGNALAGHSAADLARWCTAGQQLYGPGDSTVIGGPATSLVAAAGINAFQTTAYTMCDVYRPALCHVTPEVVPAALAAAERVGASGEALMTAISAGLECTTRICDAVGYASFRRRGWHSPGIAGALGAAFAVGLLLDLDEAELAGCVGLAGDQAAGSFAAIGTIGVKFHQVAGARAAVTAGFHALHGLLGPMDVLTAPDGGLLHAFSDAPEPARLTRDLGDRWQLTTIAIRPYPAASTLQSMINCLLEARAGHPDLATRLRHTTVHLSPEGYRLGAHDDWASQLRAMQSAPYVAAAVLRAGYCWLDLYDVAYRQDPVIEHTAHEMISVREAADLPDGAARVELNIDGELTMFERRTPIGDPQDPVPDQLLRDKITRCLAMADTKLARTSEPRRLLELDREASIRAVLTELRGQDNRGEFAR